MRREVAYLGANSPKAAQRFLDDLKQLRRNLKRFPAIGKQTDEMPVPGVLRFVMGPYLVDYEVRPGEIVIFAIRHGRERPPGVSVDDDFDFEMKGPD
ncbi:plasmid stabilization protein ParE [Rhizobium rhizosphaerae]|uniref:Plasmid stabilization protein ParE n=1 Tax=Xaviernesmea rhizosphaerae TaxID=1672749 RepID=A0ABX3PHE8_9HYPH|nr:plasmid stabilization protein ParE [Xaviernesmea rhizosphaerae]